MRIGIDLGTTFSAAAYIADNDEPQIILNHEGSHLTPSVFLMEDDNNIIIGENAKERAVIDSDRVISTVKDYMGTQREFIIGNSKFSPEEVSAAIIKKIVQDASAQLNTDIKDVVITIPAYFTDAQRKATEDAGKIAGVNVIKMINEPTAAAICYAYQKRINEGNILIYDLGGGTFDISLVRIKNKDVKVIATGGMRKLGGHFFDQLILNYLTEYLLDKYEIDLYEDEYLDDLQELTIKSEKCKIQLSSTTVANVILKIGGIKDKVTITREMFENMIDKFYKRTESSITMVLNDANMKFSDIDSILLVGGSSRIPYIIKRLEEFTGIKPSVDINPDEAVALGAAIFANSDNNVIDVCSHSIGIIVLNNTAKKINSIIIPRNTQIPAAASKNFVIPENNITEIIIELAEGEDEDLEYVNIFSSFKIEIPYGAPKGTTVNVDLQLDINQILHVFVRINVIPEIYKEVCINRKGNLQADDIIKKASLLSIKKVE